MSCNGLKRANASQSRLAWPCGESATRNPSPLICILAAEAADALFFSEMGARISGVQRSLADLARLALGKQAEIILSFSF